MSTQIQELRTMLPAPIRQAIQELADTYFNCGEWNKDSDEDYGSVAAEAEVAEIKLMQGILSLIQGDTDQGDGGSVEVEFQNVTIMVDARDPKDAYSKLCELFGTAKGWLEYTTDRYEVYDSTRPGLHGGPTSELFPQDETDPPDDN